MRDQAPIARHRVTKGHLGRLLPRLGRVATYLVGRMLGATVGVEVVSGEAVGRMVGAAVGRLVGRAVGTW